MGRVAIFGVDYSGAKADNATWLTQAELDMDAGTLWLGSCRPIKRDELTSLLKRMPDNSIAAMDFPFGVPMAFAKEWAPGSMEMADIWEAASCISLDKFIEDADHFVDRQYEYSRVLDSCISVAFSPLHKTRPNMRPMTFYGMRMLHRLWQQQGRFHVPPLPRQNAESPVLLECMPGATLKHSGLPHIRYKNGGGIQWYKNRKNILSGLSECSVSIPNLDKFEGFSLGNHDALDSTVAAVTAAMWKLDRNQFRRPCSSRKVSHPSKGTWKISPGAVGQDELTVARLEGMIFAPIQDPKLHIA